MAYTKGGITYERINGKLVRINKPTKTVGIAIGKSKTGKTITQKLTQQQISQIQQQKLTQQPTIKPILINNLPTKQKPFIGYTAQPKKTLSQKIFYRKELESSKLRKLEGKIRPIQQASTGAKVFALSLTNSLINNVKGIKQLPSTVKFLYQNPQIVRQIPSEIRKSSQKFGKILMTSPVEAMGIISGELLFMKGSSMAIKTISKTSSSILTKLNPKYVGKGTVGRKLNIKVSKTQIVPIEVVAKMPKKTIKSQLNIAGKKVSAISSQADSLLKGFIKQKTVRKPIPNEASFSKETKSLLKKFDEGKINKKELLKLDKLIKSQGAKGILERSFFADPSGKIRPSRLGIVKEKSFKIKDFKKNLIDLLTGDISLHKKKPQILLFPNIVVEKFPKSLNKIVNKIKLGKTLTNEESLKLLEFQMQKSGNFKPLGFVSRESEITLPAGSILKKDKVVGYTIINNERVPIVKTSVYKPTSSISNALKLYEDGKLNKYQIKKLDSSIKRSTGFNYGLSSEPVKGRYVSIKRLVGSSSLTSLPSRKIKTVSYSKSSKIVSKSPKIVSKSPKAVSKSPKAVSKSPKIAISKKYYKPTRTYRPTYTSNYKKYLTPKKFSNLNSIKSLSLKRKKIRFSKKEVQYMVKIVYPNGKYRPSLAALVYNITSFKVPKNINAFTVRPILKS